MNSLTLAKLTDLANADADAIRLLFFLLQNKTDAACTVAWNSLISMQDFTPEKTMAAELELLQTGFLLSTTREANQNGCVFCHFQLSAQALSIIDQPDKKPDAEEPEDIYEEPEPGTHTAYASVNNDFMENCNRMLSTDYEARSCDRFLNSTSAYVTDDLLMRLSIIVPSGSSRAGTVLSIVERGETITRETPLYGPLALEYRTVFRGDIYRLCLVPKGTVPEN